MPRMNEGRRRVLGIMAVIPDCHPHAQKERSGPLRYLKFGQNSVAKLMQKETLAAEDGWLRGFEPLTFGL
jgi:hypothetical protein